MQTKRQTLIEVVCGTAFAFCLSLCLQIFLSWAYSKPMTIFENFQWTMWFTILALVRSYGVRRFFNWLHNRK